MTRKPHNITTLCMTPWRNTMLVIRNDFMHSRLDFTLIDTGNSEVVAEKSVSYAKVDADDKNEYTLWDCLGIRGITDGD